MRDHWLAHTQDRDVIHLGHAALMYRRQDEFYLFDPWLITIPGLMLFLLVLSVNLLGDGIRDVTAPEGRN